MSDLITLVDNEVSIYTYYILQEVENQMVKVMGITFGGDNLSAL